MSKELEAFEDLTSNYPKNYSENYQIVLNSLKAFEFIKGNDYLRNFIKNWAYDYDEVNDTNLFETFNEVLK